MNYQEWEKEIYPEIAGDILWKIEAYRVALFAADIGWHDVTKLMQDKRTIKLSDQLYRALGSIGANISEGYGRYFFKENRQFSYIARGSLYETKTFLLKAKRRKLVSEAVFEKMDAELTTLAKRLNAYIAYIESKLNK